MRVFTLAVAALSSTPLVAQSAVSASLVANVPMTVSWFMSPTSTGTVTFPAGLLTTNGGIQNPGPPVLSTMWWTVPTSTFIGCVLHSDQHSYSGGYSGCSADLTLTIAGPSGTHGHVVLDMDCSGDVVNAANFRIDIGDDGSFEADSTIGPFPSLYREWCVHKVIGATPLPIRILHDAVSWPTMGYQLTVRFVPWSTRSTDLGSSCGVSQVGWFGFPYGYWARNHQYFLAALSDPATGQERLVARGYGSLAVFLASDSPLRAPVGTFAISTGCDDLLVQPPVIVAGVLTAPDEWEIVVPPLPPGSLLFAQHASLGTAAIGPPLRLGVSNLVQLQY